MRNENIVTVYSLTYSSLIQQISPLYCRHSQTAPGRRGHSDPPCLCCGKIHIIISSCSEEQAVMFCPLLVILRASAVVRSLTKTQTAEKPDANTVVFSDNAVSW